MRSNRSPRRSKGPLGEFADKSRGVRLQKALADAGVAARRECEELVLSGAVTVNGKCVDTLPAWVDPSADRIEVYGKPLRKPEKHVYIVLFKPRGTVCTNSDPAGRPRAIDLVQHPERARLYCVGRLDLDSSGLLLLTNDGELANRLTHPRYGVPKGYDITLEGSLDERAIAGIEREIFRASPGDAPVKSSLKLIARDREKTVVHLELCEHRNLQIRPLMLELGHPVKKIRRTSFGPIKLKGLAVGEWRDLTGKEIDLLRQASRGESTQPARKPKAPRRSMEEHAVIREAKAAARAAEAPATMPEAPTARSAAAAPMRHGKDRGPLTGGARKPAPTRPLSRGDGKQANTPWTDAAGASAPRGGAPRGGAPRGGAPRGGAPRGGASRSGASRGDTPAGGAPRGGSSRGGSPSGGAPRGGAPRGGAPRGSATRGSATRGSATRGSATRGGAPRGSAPRGGSSAKSGPSRSGSPRGPRRS
ncbi:MAG: pseudouridine synthase [Phycisphaera sp.]|nr:pseudouridine synthase [Phycisphaera sp.]